MRTALKCRANCPGMSRGRACDVDEIRGFAIQHQLQTVINPNVLDQAKSEMAPFRHRVLDRHDANAGMRKPSGQMRTRRDLAKS